MAANVFLQVLIFALISFALHFAWESLHVSLYTGYEGLSGTMPISLWATMGDVLYSIGAVALVSLWMRSASWLLRATTGNFVALAVVGFLIALGVEYKALLLGRWAYTSAMPIIPLLKVGLSPILQMTILLPFSVYLTKIISDRWHF